MIRKRLKYNFSVQKKKFKIRYSKKASNILLFIIPIAVSSIIYLLLINFPALGKWILMIDSIIRSNQLLINILNSIAILIIFSLVVALILYIYIDFKAHAKPLLIEDPHAEYTLSHHSKLVILPLVKYKKRQISLTVIYPIFSILLIGVSISLSLQKVLASVPTIITNNASSITTDSAILNGNLTSFGDSGVFNRGFEFGLDTNYGQTTNVSGSQSYQYDSQWSSGTLDTPSCLATDSLNNTYVADFFNYEIYKYNTSGSIIDTIGYGYSGSSAGQFSYLGCIATDSSDNLYVADAGNNRIQKFDSLGNFISTFGWGVQDGSPVLQSCTSSCRAGISGSGDGQFNSPNGVDVDSSGNIYIADSSNNRIQKFNSSFSFITKWGTSGSAEGEFDNPTYLSVSGDNNIYVTDQTNGRIQKFDTSGNYILSIGSIGTGDGYLLSPRQTVIYGNDIFVVDSGNYRIQRFNSSGVFQSKWGSYGSGNSQFIAMLGITSDNNGLIYVSDQGNDKVRRYANTIIPGSFSYNISSLNCETTYHFRAFAENNDGISYGNDQSFITASCASTTPSAPQNFVITGSTPLELIFYDAIGVQWNVPEDDGGSPVTGYVLEYKKSTDLSWTTAGTLASSQFSEIINDLDEITEYDIRIAAENNEGIGAYSTLNFETIKGGKTYDISSCQDLRKMDFDPIGTFNLTQDIDCNNYTDWIAQSLQFEGFSPIGYWNQYGFRGTLNGNGHKILNLKIDDTNVTVPYKFIGFILKSTQAKIKDLRLENIDYDISNDVAVGGFIGNSFMTEFNNVSVSGSIDAQQGYSNLGLILGSIAATSSLSTIIKSFSEVDININQLPLATSNFVFAGGLVGWSQGIVFANVSIGNPVTQTLIPELTLQDIVDSLGVDINNAYFTGSINYSGNLDTNSSAYLGGIIASSNQDNIKNVYSAGTISSQNGYTFVSGLIVQLLPGGSQTTRSKIENSFTATQLINDSYENFQSTFQLSGFPTDKIPLGIVANPESGQGLLNPLVLNNFFDSSNSGHNICFYTYTIGVGTPIANNNNSKCQSVNQDGTQSDFFKNNTTNGPLDSWDFGGSVWHTQPNDFPNFVPPSTSEDTSPTPSSSPSPTPTPTPSSSPSPVTKTKITPLPPMPRNTDSTIVKSPEQQALKQLIQPVSGLALAKNSVSNKLPSIYQKLPYFFLSLLLLVALLYAIKSWIEYRRTRSLLMLLDRYKKTTNNINNFLQITSHYMKTPVAILQSSLELFKSKNILAISVYENVYSLVSSLSEYTKNFLNSVQLSLDLESKNPAIQKTKAPNTMIANIKELYKAKQIWIPSIFVALAVAITDLFLTFTGKYSSKSLQIANHIIFFILLTILLVACYYLHLRSKKINAYWLEELVKEKNLLSQKSIFLGTTSQELQIFEKQIDNKSQEFKNVEGTAVFFNGLRMLKNLIESIGISSLLSSGQFTSPSQPISLALNNVIGKIQDDAKQRNISINLIISPDSYVNATMEQSQYIFKEILGNAIKFSPDNTEINTSITSTKRGIIITISDEGPGIPSDKLNNLFLPFNEGSLVKSYEQKSLGLGLYNTKLIVEKLGGTISLSNNKNKGLTATIKLPKGKNSIGQTSQIITPQQ